MLTAGTSSAIAIPELIAHRGYPLHYPENSLIGIEAAIRAGARYIEVDVQLTRDQVPVLFHDATLARVCNAPGKVYDLDFDELRRLRAGEYARFGYRYAQVRVAALAELAELLARHPQVTAFVELKGESVDRFGPTIVAARVRRALERVASRCVFISYDLEALRAMRTNGPIGAVIDRWRDRRRPALAALRPEYLFCAREGLPWFGRLRFDGARLAVFELGTDARRSVRLAERGVDLVETFAIGELAAELELLAAANRHARAGL
jgi:glycerophosphoryl diester phosphodiesterase